MLKKTPSPSNAAMLNGLYGKNHENFQLSIAEIDIRVTFDDQAVII